MVQDPGDKGYKDGDAVNLEAASDVFAGDVVTVNSSGNVAPVTGNGTDVAVGVVADGGGASSGSIAKVIVDGVVWAQAETDASQGDTVGDNGGSNANHEEGELSVDGNDWIVLETDTKADPEDGNDEDYVLVAKL